MSAILFRLNVLHMPSPTLGVQRRKQIPDNTKLSPPKSSKLDKQTGSIYLNKVSSDDIIKTKSVCCHAVWFSHQCHHLKLRHDVTVIVTDDNRQSLMVTTKLAFWQLPI